MQYVFVNTPKAPRILNKVRRGLPLGDCSFGQLLCRMCQLLAGTPRCMVPPHCSLSAMPSDQELPEVEGHASEPWRVHVPATSIPERVHRDDHLLLWQVRGNTDFVISGDPLVLPVGQAVWIPAGAPHALTVRANSVLLTLVFPLAVTATTLRQTTVVNVDRDLRTLLLACLQTQNSIIRPPVNLERQVLSLIEESPVLVTSLPMPTTEAALFVAETLRFNPGDDRSVEALAAASHVSYRTVERAFQKETGISLGQWRIRNRMEAAGILLRTQASVPAVAARVGYTNVSAFGRVFKAHFELTPTEYIRRYNPHSQVT